MTIQLAQAGWEYPLAGMFIGVHRLTTQEFYWQEIPGRAFQGSAFGWRPLVSQATERLLTKIAGGQKDVLEFQRHPVFTHLSVPVGMRLRLTWSPSPLPWLLEVAYLQRLHRLGMRGVHLGQLQERPDRLFRKCAAWVQGDAGCFPARRQLWKTGVYPLPNLKLSKENCHDAKIPAAL